MRPPTFLPLILILAIQGSAKGDLPEISYTLEKPGYVSLALENEKGERVRHLVAARWREAGTQKERWDGLDDQGRPAPAGNYRWKGITRSEITSHFLGSFNAPGNPPWLTQQIAVSGFRNGGNGGWLSDHERPKALHATGNGRVFMGANIAEEGHAIAVLDLEGNKQWGTVWLGLSGADAIVVDDGILYVAGERGWMKDSLAVSRLDAERYSWVPNPSSRSKGENHFIKVPTAEFGGIKGMAISNNHILLSLSDRNRIALFNKETSAFEKEFSLPEAGALWKRSDGVIFGVSGDRVVEIDLENGNLRPVISNHLKRASGLTGDRDGNFYVTDIAPEEQCVKVFNSKGELVRRIGKAGGRKEGSFDPLAMENPVAVAVDEKGQVWVAEYSYNPKRVSVWNTNGDFLFDKIGGGFYGGGGSLDPKDPTRGFYKGMEFQVKEWPETSKLKNLLFREDEHRDLPWLTVDSFKYRGDHAESHLNNAYPHSAAYRGDRLYLVNDEGYGVKALLIGEVKGSRFVPEVIFGSWKVLWGAWGEKYPELLSKLGVSKDATDKSGVFLWQDLNENGKAEPEEVSVQAGWVFGATWSMRSWPTFSLYARDKDRVISLEPIKQEKGLRYDFAKAKGIPLPPDVVKKGFSALAPDTDGNVLINVGGGGNQGDKTNVFMSLSPEGKVNWTYPNPYPTNTHNSPRPQVGEIYHTLNIDGIVPLKEGGVFQLNGNKGTRYLMTTDGLFVAELFGDMRLRPFSASLTTAEKGLRMDQHSLGDECFQGWIGRVSDGRVLQIANKGASLVLEVKGLDSVERLSGGSITLDTPVEVKRLEEGAAVPIRAIAMGGIPRGWEKSGLYPLPPKDPVGRFAVGFDKNSITVSVEVTKPGGFSNHGDDFKTLFKTGDCVDFRIATSSKAAPDRKAAGVGDYRFIFSEFEGKPVAVRYRFVAPQIPEGRRVKFASPTGVAVVDQVTLEKDVKVQIERNAKGYRLSARIPWTALGLTEEPTGDLKGDVGVIVGDEAGSRAVARYYYFDLESQVVSDLPSEVRVNPANWGTIEF